MQVKKYNTGIYDVNTYMIVDEETKEAAIIDYGGESANVINDIEQQGLKLKYILNTHGHFDHISGEKSLQEKYGAPVYIHKSDKLLVGMLEAVLIGFGARPIKPPKIDVFVDENTDLSIGNTKITVIETPGHTKGGVCYLAENNLFSGDTLFLECIGRTDLPGGSYKELVTSIKDKLFVLDDSTIVYPGHGDSSTIEHEKLNNTFVV